MVLTSGTDLEGYKESCWHLRRYNDLRGNKSRHILTGHCWMVGSGEVGALLEDEEWEEISASPCKGLVFRGVHV